MTGFDPLIVFDLVLAIGIVWMGWASLAARDAFGMVVAFMAFGILVALAWVRLGAPDVALAEAAVGAGVTGALLLRTVASLRRPEPAETAGPALKAAAAAASLTVAGIVAWALLGTPEAGGYDALVAENLAESGVSNPVTAVLLNFRAYDTLLEVVVLAAALMAAAMVGARQEYAHEGLGPLFAPFARLIVPLTFVVAAHLLWLGSSRPGGAFQAGAVLAAGLIVLLLGRVWRPGAGQAAPLRWLALGGLMIFAGAACLSFALTGGLLQYPAGADLIWIVAIESALTVSIGVVLAALFHGGLPKGGEG